jgi:hypothetical protein
MKYEISGINAEDEDERRKDYIFAFKTIHEVIDGAKFEPKEYDIKNGVLIVSIEEEINSLELRKRLAERGLELKVL